MFYKWKYKESPNNNYYHDEDGMIVGEIVKINFCDDVWHASVNTDGIGQFISKNHAMAAVERIVQKNIEDDERMKREHPTLYGVEES